MALDLTSFSSVLKTLYPKLTVQALTYRDNPFWAMVEKAEDFYGANMVIPFRYADPETSRSRTVSTAITARSSSSSKYAKVTLTRGHDFGAIQIDRETIMASSNDAGAFLRARQAEINAMLNALGRSIAVSLFGNGSGVRGSMTVADYTVNAAVTLDEANDITNFEVGQALFVASNNPATGTAPTIVSSSTTAYVVGINRDAGTITLAATYGGSAASPNTAFGVTLTNTTQYFLLPAGDNVGFSSTSNSSAIAGLSAWLPTTAPTTGDNFFGLDRSVDAARLAGIRYTGTGLPIEEALVKAAARVARDGGRPDTVFVNFNQYSNLVTSLGSKARYTDRKVGDIGFASLVLYGPRGELNIVPDMNCPNGRAYMLQLDTWKFHSLLEAPHIVTEGNVSGALQEASADAIQVRGAVWGQLACTAPGYNAVVTLDT